MPAFKESVSDANLRHTCDIVETLLPLDLAFVRDSDVGKLEYTLTETKNSWEINELGGTHLVTSIPRGAEELLKITWCVSRGPSRRFGKHMEVADGQANVCYIYTRVPVNQ